jgi:DNA polymerase-1
MVRLVNYGAEVVNHFTNILCDEAWCIEKFGVNSSLLTDYLALVGDSTDSIPGVPRIGDKTASKLLNQFASLEGVLAAASQDLIKGAAGQSLRDHAEIARLSFQLATLRMDPAALNFKFDAMKVDWQHLLQQNFFSVISDSRSMLPNSSPSFG